MTNEWIDKKQTHSYRAKSLREILGHAGFGNVGGGWKKGPCLVYVDLITPCPNWQGSAGKTHIDLMPYQKTIAETVFEMASKMPSVRTNTGSGYSYSSSTGRKGMYMKDYLKPFLKQRRVDVDRDPSLKIRDRLTQSGVWYRIEPEMRINGFEPQKNWGKTRKSLQGRIAQAIKELWGDEITREDLGIVAKAVLYFNGEKHLITSDSIQSLAKTRTSHMVIIEKEGVTDVLLELAKPFRIALVATAGKPVEYAKDLAKVCNIDNASGKRIRVCTIYDDDLIGRESADAFIELGANVPRIGVDKNTVRWLQENEYKNIKLNKRLELTDVLEDYKPQYRRRWKYDDYLRRQKIEIDMIIAKVGAEALWKWILYKLTETFKEPIDYRDIVDEPNPEDFYSKTFSDLQEYTKSLHELAYNDEWNTIQKELEAVECYPVSAEKELLNIDDKNEEIYDRLETCVNKNEHIKTIVDSIKKLLESLPSIDGLKKEGSASRKIL